MSDYSNSARDDLIMKIADILDVTENFNSYDQAEAVLQVIHAELHPAFAWDEPLDTNAYRLAPSMIGDDGIGSLPYEWQDKPHRLLYRLCNEVDTLRENNHG